MLYNNFIRFLISVSVLLITPNSWALPTDSRQPIEIEADTATIDNGKGQAVYTGHVVITQGSIRIQAEKVTLHFTAQQNLNKVVAVGQPVQFKQTPNQGKEDIHAKARQMDYFAKQDMLHLKQKAEVWQGKDTLVGETIKYNTKTEVMQASKGKQKNDKVIVVIHPNQQSNK